jgi:hypothetical protein
MRQAPVVDASTIAYIDPSLPTFVGVFPTVPLPYISGLKDETLKDYIRKQM